LTLLYWLYGFGRDGKIILNGAYVKNEGGCRGILEETFPIFTWRMRKPAIYFSWYSR
jgi:hypothetical protein